MKTLLTISLLIVITLSSCVSSKNHFRKGQYDAAIRTATHKLKKKPEKEKEILYLDRAYKYAMQADNERIEFLRRTGQPDIWEEIFEIYARMKSRQEIVRVLPESVLARINFRLVDFDFELIEAKKKAAEFLYAHSMRLLQDGGKQNARSAYGQLLRVKSYFSVFKDVDTQIERALSLGISNILFDMRNNTGVALPASFENEIKRISLSNLNTQWLRYETTRNDNKTYDFFILLNIRLIDVSPESVKEIHYAETKEVPDGFQYVLDANGNVMKDSLGNDIKTPKTKVISCNVIETELKKTVTVSGTIDFIEVPSAQLIRTSPITSQFFFEHVFAVAHGNYDALSPRTKEKLNIRPVPFPNDFEMILGAADILKNMAKDIIRQNRHVFY